MAEADMRTNTASEGEHSSTVSHKTAESEKMAPPNKSSGSRSGSRSKSSGKAKKDDLKALEDKWESRFTGFESKMTQLMEIFSSLENVSSQKETVTEGEQRPNSDNNCMNNDSSGVHRTEYSDNENDNFPVEQDSICQNDLPLSLAPGQSERRELGCLDDEQCSSVSHIDLNNNMKSNRFRQYLKVSSNDNSEEKSASNNLVNLFGEDAKAKCASESVGIVLHSSQIDILGTSWHTETPDKLTAYKDEYKSCFPVHDKSLEHLQVPSLDNMVPVLLQKKHGNKALSSTGKMYSLHTPFIKGIEKLAIQGQVASRMGIIAAAYTQQALGTLLETLQQKDVNVDKSVQLVRDIFAMSTKTLDQVARCGAFHHLVHRKATMEDTGLVGIKDLSLQLFNLPLSETGVFGKNLEQTLKDRTEQSKQLKDLLPELCTTVQNKSSNLKRNNNSNNSSNDWQSKKSRLDSPRDNFKNSNYTIPKRKPAETKSYSVDKYEKTSYGNFRGRGKQKK